MSRFPALIFAAVATLAAASQAMARPADWRMPLGAETAPPVGYLQFCAGHADQCQEFAGRVQSDSAPMSDFWRQAFHDEPTSSVAAADDWRPLRSPVLVYEVIPADAPPEGRLALTDAALDLLNGVNRRVNRAIAPVGDRIGRYAADVWSLPLTEGYGAGDCEDYVLEKRRALVARGVPAAALSIAVVRTRHGETHAVLLVDTDAGELVLDNRSQWIARWDEVDYRWVKRQSPFDPAQWVRVGAL